MITKAAINRCTYEIIGAAIEVHKNLGPGLLESVYHTCFIAELIDRDLKVDSQQWVPVKYKGKILESRLKLDLLVEDTIIIELKAVETMIPLYKAQLLSYLKLTGKPKGLLINFHCEKITEQLVSLVTENFASLPDK